MTRPPVRLADCPDCHRKVIWGTLQSGHSRTFEPEPRFTRDVPPAERYAYSRRYRAVVCLDGERNPPGRVHVPHYCREYRDNRLMRNVESLEDVDLPFLKPAAPDPEDP